MRLVIPERLEGRGVVIRPLRADDAGSYAAAFKDDPELGALLGVEDDPTPEQLAEKPASIEEGAAAGRWLELAIARPADQAFLGTVIGHSFSERHRRAEIGFWVVPAARRTGVATAAVSRFLDWLFDDLELDRVEMTTLPDNGPTRGLAARLGFAEEGLLRRRNLERGRRVDLITFGLLREEWPPSPPSPPGAPGS